MAAVLSRRRLVTGLLGLGPIAASASSRRRCTSAFRAIFSFGSSLADLDRGQVGNFPAAIANARVFAGEVLSILKPAGAREAA